MFRIDATELQKLVGYTLDFEDRGQHIKRSGRVAQVDFGINKVHITLSHGLRTSVHAVNERDPENRVVLDRREVVRTDIEFDGTIILRSADGKKIYAFIPPVPINTSGEHAA